MKIKEQLNTLVQKEMDRKEFLKYGGLVVLSVVGVTGLVKTLTGTQQAIFNNGQNTQQPRSQAGGYGMSAYGR